MPLVPGERFPLNVVRRPLAAFGVTALLVWWFARRDGVFYLVGVEGWWSEVMGPALTALCAALAASPETARLCFVEAPGAGPATFAQRKEALRGLLPLFEAAPDDTMRGLPFRESLSIGRIGDLGEMLGQEIAAGETTTLPRLVPQLTYMMVLPVLGPERAAEELAGERRLRPAS